MNIETPFKSLADRDLIAEVKRLAQAERSATAALVASLAEMDVRRLYLGESCSSLFTYCTQVLHLSEHAAYGRIEAARAVRRFPVILERLERGELTLTAVSLLRQHLTDANCCDLLDAARHKSKRDIERLVATIAPRPDAAAIVRKLPVRVAAASPSSIEVRAPDAVTAAGLTDRAADGRTNCSSPALPIGVEFPPRRRPNTGGTYRVRSAEPCASGRDAARAGALQGAVHRQPRNARQAAPRAGSAEARRAEWRSRGDCRPRPDAARRAAGKSKARQREARPAIAPIGAGIAQHSCGRATRCVGAG
jgi:hypothetical protein